MIQKTWFVVYWDIDGSHFEGPFGDDKIAAVTNCKAGLRSGQYEAAAVVELPLEQIYVEEDETTEA